MPNHDRFHKPRVLPAVPTIPAALAAAAILGTLLAFRLGAIPEENADLAMLFLIATGVGLASVTRRFERRDPDDSEPRSLRIERGELQQLDANGDPIVSIDLASPFEYRILGPTNQPNAEFLLFQGKITLRFFEEDAGARDAIRDALQIQWPRRPRAFMSRTP